MTRVGLLSKQETRNKVTTEKHHADKARVFLMPEPPSAKRDDFMTNEGLVIQAQDAIKGMV
jgi:hypothetical protein